MSGWFDERWRDRAACSGRGRDTPFHYGQAGYSEEAAKRICGGCPVAADCLDAAMRMEAQHKGIYRFGVWGMLNATERTQLSLTDNRYAIYPDDLTELEVRTIFEEVIADMKARFQHTVDNFKAGEVVDLGTAAAEHYVGGGHAVPVSAPKPPAKPKAAPSKGRKPKDVEVEVEPEVEPTSEADDGDDEGDKTLESVGA